MISDREVALYKRLSGKRRGVVPSPFRPKPTDKDYKVGEIRRYFAQQTTQPTGEITEVSKAQFEALKTNPLYRVVDVRWKISGPVEDTLDPETEEVKIVGAENSNKASIRIAAKTIPTIHRKLNNPLQFYQSV